MRLERGALRSERLAGCREARAVDRAHFEWAYRHDKRAEPRLPRLTAPAYWKFESISLQRRDAMGRAAKMAAIGHFRRTV
jgi:hypothetical protein